jgi:hypothetical protein
MIAALFKPLSTRTDQSSPLIIGRGRVTWFEPVTSRVTRKVLYHWTALRRGIFLFELNDGLMKCPFMVIHLKRPSLLSNTSLCNPGFVCAYFRYIGMIWVPGICMFKVKMRSKKRFNFANFWKIECMRRRWIICCLSWPLHLKSSFAKQRRSRKSTCNHSSRGNRSNVIKTKLDWARRKKLHLWNYCHWLSPPVPVWLQKFC